MPRLQLKGVNLMPARESFDPIETASRDEITALQLTPGAVERSLGKAKRVIDLREGMIVSAALRRVRSARLRASCAHGP